ncbi:MAG: DUF1559 domain-containing protein [Planctomycetes bacterium]|nr:DUF1559 domain-containing protein [Planctomycetota bacterium]
MSPRLFLTPSPRRPVTPSLPAPRRGIGRIELAVLAGVAVVIACLAIPYLQHSRARARMTRCARNLEAIAVAVGNYVTYQETLPSGFDSARGWGWGTLLLPYRDAQAVYRGLNVDDAMALVGPEHERRRELARTLMPLYVCPADQLASPGQHAKTAVVTNRPPERTAIAISNYVGVAGSRGVDCPEGAGNGLLYHNSGIPLDETAIPDGLAYTFLIGERDGTRRLGSNWAGTSYVADAPTPPFPPLPRGGQGGCRDPFFVSDATPAGRPINGRDPRSFGSLHEGGAFFLMADGSGRFLSEAIDTQARLRLANRHDTAPP